MAPRDQRGADALQDARFACQYLHTSRPKRRAEILKEARFVSGRNNRRANLSLSILSFQCQRHLKRDKVPSLAPRGGAALPTTDDISKGPFPRRETLRERRELISPQPTIPT